MAQRAYKGVLNTFSIGGSSQLAFLREAEVSIDPVLVEASSILYPGGNNNETKREISIMADLMSDVTAATDRRDCHLQVSAATLGAVNLLSPQILGDFDFTVEHVIQQSYGTSQAWAVPITVDRMLKASLNLAVDSTAAPALLSAMGSSTYTDRDLILDVTIDGVQIQVPMRAGPAKIPITKDGLIHFTIDLFDRSARSGVTVLPSGTTSLLEKAINSYSTVVAYSFIGAAANAISIAGNMVWKSYNMKVRDREIISVVANWENTGTPPTFTTN